MMEKFPSLERNHAIWDKIMKNVIRYPGKSQKDGTLDIIKHLGSYELELLNSENLL